LADARLEPEVEAIGLAEPPVTAAVRDKRVEILRTRFRDFEQILIPVCAPPRPATCQHWTLLSIRRVSNEVQVEYFETLQDMHKIALGGAHTLLSLLEVDKKLLHGKLGRLSRLVHSVGGRFAISLRRS
jgi:hypothetical protein